jgi:glycosyltransferase involved in cell wall biosynthesis
VQAWHEAGWIRYHGETRDVRPWLQQCHVYVLPSYHEGMPRTVLEALATGRPVLTTDVSGCKETVVAGENGWLVPAANASALAERMSWFIENPERWPNMAAASRRLAEEKFDVQRVNEAMLRIIQGLAP